MINYIQEFDRQWEILEAEVASSISDQLKRRGSVQIDDLNEVYQDEQNRWRSMSQVNYSWMEMLQREYPQIAEAFEEKLYRFALDKEQEPKAVSKMPMVVAAVAGAVVGYLAANLLSPWGMFVKLAFAVLVGITGGWIMKNNLADKETARNIAIGKMYLAQLSVHADELRSLLSEIK